MGFSEKGEDFTANYRSVLYTFNYILQMHIFLTVIVRGLEAVREMQSLERSTVLELNWNYWTAPTPVLGSISVAHSPPPSLLISSSAVMVDILFSNYECSFHLVHFWQMKGGDVKMEM